MRNDTQPQSVRSWVDGGPPSEPQVLGPRLPMQPAAFLAVAVVLIVGFIAFDFFGRSLVGRTSDLGGPRGHALLTVPADTARGAFTVLPSNFQQAPGSVLAQLKMPEAEKQRLAEKLADGSVRLAAVTVWDTMDEDGDVVEISAAGFVQQVTITRKPATFFVPLHPGGNVTIKAVRDGYGGVTLGVRTITGSLPLPRLAVGQSLEMPAL